TPEQLGGARMHAVQSGVVHNLVASEEEAFAQARVFLSLLPASSDDALPIHDEGDIDARVLGDLLDIVPADLNRPYDMHDVLHRLADSNALLELQPLYGASLITALARI